MLIGGPHFLPLVELLLLPSSPPFLPPSLSLFKNKCHIPAISYLLCWQPQWPVEDLPQPPPPQPVHSRRRPVYTVLIGSALLCPCDLWPLPRPPLTRSLFRSLFSPSFFFLLSYSVLAPLVLSLSSPPLYTSCTLWAQPSVGLWSTHSGTGEAALLCGSPGSTDVNQSGFLQPFLKWAQGPRWVSAVAGPDLQLIRRKEVTFVPLVGAQFRHPKLAWE